MSFDPYDDQANLRHAQESWRHEQRRARLEALLAKRPPEFAAEGALEATIQDWLEGFLRGLPGALVIVGGVGAGKTWSLWKIAETLVSRGWRGRVEIVEAYTLKQATAPPVDEHQLRVWRECDLLAIDDLGAQRVSDWDLDNLHALVDQRRQWHRPLIITSNNPNLRSLLDERIASRIGGGATTVMLSDMDRRRTQ